MQLNSISSVAEEIVDVLASGAAFSEDSDGNPQTVIYPIGTGRSVELALNPYIGPVVTVLVEYRQWAEQKREVIMARLLTITSEQRFALGWIGGLASEERLMLCRPISLQETPHFLAQTIENALTCFDDNHAESTGLSTETSESPTDHWIRL